MSFLRNLESKISNLVEGTFSRAFSSEVRPIEIARKLAREMEEHKSFSVSRTYVPNEYRVFLSPSDRARLAEYEEALIGELSGYLLEHARRERLAMVSRPVIEFHTDDRLRLGEFGIQTSVTQVAPEAGGIAEAEAPPAGGAVGAHEAAPSAPAPGPEPLPLPGAADDQPGGGRTMVYSTAERVAEPLEENARIRQQTAALLVEGKRVALGESGVTVGRSRQCEVVVDDPNVSRRHAELRPRGGSWVLTDLGSTNGSRVNGRTVSGPTVVKPGDEIELGTAVMKFELS
jgi:Protein of unknown function (DUF3662)/Inner membrane component of T3SS, cytoplasmic domain